MEQDNRARRRRKNIGADDNGTTWDEADIGSGEKTPAQLETEDIIRQIPALPERDRSGPARDDVKCARAS